MLELVLEHFMRCCHVLKEENKRKIYIITQKGKERLELEKERMQKQIILFMKKDYEDEI